LGKCLLTVAAALSIPEMAAGSLAGGNQPDLVAPLGQRQPLIEAVRQYNLSEVERLLFAEADVNQMDALGRTALHYASALELVAFVELLLGAVPVNPDPVDNDGFTPLHRAAQRGNAAIIGLLMAAGADPHRPNQAGETPLSLARILGRPDIVQLLEGGAP
jgi:ankyrin repeat protein